MGCIRTKIINTIFIATKPSQMMYVEKKKKRKIDNKKIKWNEYLNRRRRPTICFLPSCDNTNFNQLKLCNGCRVISYCSKHCQKLDWKRHRSWCKDVTNGK